MLIPVRVPTTTSRNAGDSVGLEGIWDFWDNWESVELEGIWDFWDNSGIYGIGGNLGCSGH